MDIFLAKQTSFIHPFDFYYDQVIEHNIHLTLRHVNNIV